MKCTVRFSNQRRKSGKQKRIWYDYVWGKQTSGQLAVKYRRSAKWIRQQIETIKTEEPKIKPGPIILILDVVFNRRTFGVLVGRDYESRKNIYWRIIYHENTGAYYQARHWLEANGYIIRAVVIDGKRGVQEVFSDLPVQLCQFHQIAAINRYLTRKPKLQAGKELRTIALSITKTTAEKLIIDLADWHECWQEFIKEKTSYPETGHWSYTHRRIRSAYRSLKINSEKLFTYQKYPGLDIPNTTNSLDGGTFAHLKDLLRLHRGLKRERKIKLIFEILSK